MHINLRVLDSARKPVYYARVALGGYGLNYGVYPEQYTNNDGYASFDNSITEGDSVAVYVNGNECLSNVRAEPNMTVII